MIKPYIITTDTGTQFTVLATDKSAALIIAKELLFPEKPVNASLNDEW